VGSFIHQRGPLDAETRRGSMIYPNIKYLGPAHPMRVADTETKADETFVVPVRRRQRARGSFRQPHASAAFQVIDISAAHRAGDLELPLAA
jgi:hypothetical protein